MRYRTLRVLAARLACVALVSPLLPGCGASGGGGMDENDSVKFGIRASNREIVVGETVTVTPRTENTYGRDATVEWTTTGGRITPEENGRIARATFDQPGTYTITGKLFVDNAVAKSDSVDIKVRPLP